MAAMLFDICIIALTAVFLPVACLLFDQGQLLGGAVSVVGMGVGVAAIRYRIRVARYFLGRDW
jgi:hypothetical protein